MPRINELPLRTQLLTGVLTLTAALACFAVVVAVIALLGRLKLDLFYFLPVLPQLPSLVLGTGLVLGLVLIWLCHRAVRNMVGVASLRDLLIS